MRILEFRLLRFGLFTDRILDFEAEGKNHHVIFGSNEAGKSTILRAITGFLFGIPETTSDDHVHKKSELRLGARIETGEGQQLELIRRKGRKNTLLDMKDTPVEDNVLDDCFSGVGRELYETMFGLSHEILLRGGADLLAGKGELGESLFSAGLGISGFHEVRTSLWKKTGEIFSPRSQTLPLNVAIKTFQEAKKKSVQLSLRPRDWQEHQERLASAIQQREKLDTELSTASADLNRLSRIQRTHPLIYRRKECFVRLKELGEVRELSESSSDERKEAQRILQSINVREQKLFDEKQLCESEIDKLVVPEALIALEPGIMMLRDNLGAHKKAMQDLPSLHTRVAAWTDEALSILRELGRDISLNDVEKLRVDAATEVRIRALTKENTKMGAELNRVQKDAKETEKKLEELRQGYAQLPPKKDAGSLRRVVAEARKQGDLEKQLRNLQVEIAGLKEKAQAQLSALSLWDGSLEEVIRLSLPFLETVERFSKLLQNLEKERQQINIKKDGTVERFNELTKELMKLEAKGAVPTTKELEGSRSKRNEIWKRIRMTWVENIPIDEIMPETLATEYERKVSDADEVADRLWREADRTARYSTLGTEKEQRESEIAGYDIKIDGLTRSEDSISAQWKMQWEPAGIEPLPPEEMKSWLAKHEKLIVSVNGWKERFGAKDILLEEIKRYKDLCASELLKIGEPGVEEDGTLSGLLSRSEEIIIMLQDKDQKRQQLVRDFEKTESIMKDLNAELEQSQNALAKWKDEWGKAVKGIGFDENASTEEVEVILLGLSRLFQKVNDIRKDEIRIDHINEDSKRFSGEVSELVLKCASDLQGQQSEKAAMELISRFDKGKENQKATQTLTNRLSEIHKELAEIKRDREAADMVLKQLMEKASCSNLDDMEEAEKRSKEYRELSVKLTDIEDQMLNEGVPIEELVKQAESIPPDLLLGDIQELENKTSVIKGERDQLQVDIGSIQKAIEGMDGSRDAADAAAEAEEALASIRDNAERYVRLKLAALLLDREIERYREQNQGPILKRTGEMFSRITLGAYTGLTTDFSVNDQLILICVRKNGDRVPVDGLSDGTRDQLYFALRLASLERHVAKNEPLPIIIDDVLINFDDERALATLELLSEFSEKTQILFFTHHTKLLDLARSAVPSNILKEHTL